MLLLVIINFLKNALRIDWLLVLLGSLVVSTLITIKEGVMMEINISINISIITMGYWLLLW